VAEFHTENSASPRFCSGGHFSKQFPFQATSVSVSLPMKRIHGIAGTCCDVNSACGYIVARRSFATNRPSSCRSGALVTKVARYSEIRRECLGQRPSSFARTGALPQAPRATPIRKRSRTQAPLRSQLRADWAPPPGDALQAHRPRTTSPGHRARHRVGERYRNRRARRDVAGAIANT
jgi:hypothetical protein